MKERILYLDIAKFIGIFCIYLGHFGSAAGNGYAFVFYFHVALFFFISGCSESLSSDVPWHKYILKNIKCILLPFYFFAFISLFTYCVYADSHSEIMPNIQLILKGCIRNQYFAGGLWFLTCLFIIKISFHFLRKLLKYKALILITCICLFIFAQTVINPTPLISPHMIYNIDSACYYIIFYALGYCCFDYINKLFICDRPYKKIITACAGTICLLYSALLFWGKNLLNYLNVIPNMNLVSSLLCPIMIIFFIFIVSKLLENVPLFLELGKNTLFLCGSEYIIKLVIPILLQTIGLNITLSNPIGTYFYTFILLVICNKTLVPIEKLFFRKINLL